MFLSLYVILLFFYTLFKLKHGTIVFDEKIQSKLFKEENVSFENKNITLVYSIFFSPNSRLYTDRIYDTAIIKNNLLWIFYSASKFPTKKETTRRIELSVS